MSDKRSDKSFLQLTWQQVLSAVIVAIFLGAVSWIGATLQGALDDLDDLQSRLTIAETQIDVGVLKSIDSLKEEVKQMNTQLGSTNANQRRVEILVSRLEVIVSKLEEDSR